MCIGDWGCARCRLRDGRGQKVITSEDESDVMRVDAGGG